MQEAKARLETALKNTPIREPLCTFIPNVTASPVANPEEIRTLLARQLTSSVQWVQTMATAKQQGITTYFEIGPGRILKGLARKCQPELDVYPFGAIADLKNLEPLHLVLKA